MYPAIATRPLSICLALALLCGGAAPAWSQGVADGVATVAGGAVPIDPDRAPRPVARAARASGVTIDGRLDDAAWSAAQPITGFVQALPRTGYPASERTVVRVLYDDDALYIAAFCYDSRPVTVMSLEQDYETHDSDVFGVALDTYLDRRNAFMFLVNPRGALKDGQAFDDSRDLNLAWEGVVHIETAVADSGWSVEMSIPWTTLRFPGRPGEQAWGLQLLRRIRRLNEDDYWAPVGRRDHIHRMSRAGTLTGLTDLHQGRNLTLKPYVKAATSGVPAEPTTGAPRPGLGYDGSLDAGLDLKWGVTPTLTLDATYNTDFSQTEVDEEQVNLTRFSLFYPERRDFFIENSGVFTFGDVSERNYRTASSLENFTLFHSRRIGLESGRPVPIVGGGRLTGNAGGLQVGVIDMQTERTDATSPENFLVTRLRRNILGSSDIGAIFINRAATDGTGSSQSWGVDGNFTLLRNLIINSYVAGTVGRSDGADVGGPAGATGMAGRVAVGWRDPLWDVSAFAKSVDAGFAPSVGFVRRAGIHEYYGTLGIHPAVELGPIYELNPYAEADYTVDSGLASRRTTIGLASQLLSGGTAELQAADRFERLDAPFAIAEDVVLPAGRYHFRDVTATYTPSGARPLSGQLSVATGQFYDGIKTSVGVGALWRLNPQLSFDVTLNHNDVRLREGDFTAEVAGGRVVYAFSRKLFTSAFLQYNNASDQLVTNVRLDFIHAPLSDLFLVLVERRDLAAHAVLERTVALKVTRLFGF